MKRIDNILLRLLYAYVLFSLCNLIYLHKLVTRTGRDERHWLAFTHQHDKTKSLDEAQSGDKITDSTVNVNFPSKSVVTPVLVFLISTVAPGIGMLLSSFITPVIVLCEYPTSVNKRNSDIIYILFIIISLFF